MAKPRCFATDPATGKSCSLPELADRYQLNDSTIRERYHNGLRGWRLVAPVHPGKSLAASGAHGLGRRVTPRQGHTGALEFAVMLDCLLDDPCNRWLTKPLVVSA